MALQRRRSGTRDAKSASSQPREEDELRVRTRRHTEPTRAEEGRGEKRIEGRSAQSRLVVLVGPRIQGGGRDGGLVEGPLD